MKALLVLEDGFMLEGKSFTGEFETGGEVIFTTAMTGYQEVLTDPSYHSQMVCMTYPLIGNYGINFEDMESSSIHLQALLVKECCKLPSNFRSEMSLPDFLEKHGKVGIEGIDTRSLTRHLRINGAMRGIISTKESDVKVLQEKAKALPTMEGQNLIAHVQAKKTYAWINNAVAQVELENDGKYAFKGNGIPLLIYDFGLKWNILRQLCEAGFEPLAVPPNFSVKQAKDSGAKAVFLSNGPGDPATLSSVIELVRDLGNNFPMAGICLGHQIIAHAFGAKTKKLKFGHHGCNHPVKDLTTGKIEISSQNHGFHVVDSSSSDIEITHINLNDGTVEGLKHKQLPIISLQYHPEAAAGPRDGHYFFGRFKELVK